MADLLSEFNNVGIEFTKVRDKILERGTFDEWCESLKISSRTEKEFLKSWNGIGDISESYQKQMIDNANANSRFANSTTKTGDILKSLGDSITSMGVNAALGFLIDFAATGIYNLIHANEQAIEASNNAKETISNLKDEAQQTAQVAENAGLQYAQLAQGINQIDNTNISLSTDEYETFLDLSNQLAQLFPTLIQGYDDQGNAILNLGGNIDDINKKIQTQIDKKKDLNSLEQYQAFMGEGVDEDGKERENGYYKGAKIKVDNIAQDKQHTEDQLGELQKRAAIFTPDTKENNKLKDLIADKNIDWSEKRDRVTKFLKQNMDSLGLNSQERTKYENILLREFDESDKAFDEDTLNGIHEFLNEVIYKKQQDLKGFNESLKQQNTEISQNAQAVFERSLGYNNLNDNQKKIGNQVFNNLQWDKVTTEYGAPVYTEEEAEQYIQNFAKKLSRLDGKDLLNLDKLFSLNYEDMPVDEAKATIEQYLATLSEKFGMTSEQLKDFLGFGDFFKLSEKYDNVVSYAADSKGFNRQDVVNAMKDNGINTDEEINKFKETLENATSLEGAIKSYVSSTAKQTDITPLSFSKAWDSIGTSGNEKADKSAKEENQSDKKTKHKVMPLQLFKRQETSRK